MKSFIQHLTQIGQDILKVTEVVAPIVGIVDPPLAPILAEVSQIIGILEGRGANVSSDQLSTIIQGVTTAAMIKNSAAAAQATK